MKLLHVDSSISGDQSASRQLTAKIVASLKKADPSAEVIYHDLAAEPLAHLSAAALDHQERYLKGLFVFIGVTDISFVRAEGLGICPASRMAAMDSAAVEIQKLAA